MIWTKLLLLTIKFEATFIMTPQFIYLFLRVHALWLLVSLTRNWMQIF